MISTIWTLLFYMFVIYSAMFNHVSDGNVWGIYVTNNVIHVGDFWASIALLFSIYKVIESAKTLYGYL